MSKSSHPGFRLLHTQKAVWWRVVAIIVISTLAALKAKDQVEIEWDETAAASDSLSAHIVEAARLSSREGDRAPSENDAAHEGGVHDLERLWTIRPRAIAPRKREAGFIGISTIVATTKRKSMCLPTDKQ